MNDRESVSHGWARRRGGVSTSELLGLVMGLALVLPGPSSAWQAVPTAEGEAGLDDPRWSAFVGCWEPLTIDEATQEGILCVRPAGEGVEMFTISDGEVLTSDFLIADRVARPIRAEGCAGDESVSFSDDGRRVFTRTSYTCGGVEQAGTGVLAHVTANQWVDARSIEVDGERTSWVQRYRLVGMDRAADEGVGDPGFGMETAARVARYVAHRGVGFTEVGEAATSVDAGAVEAWLANRSEGFTPTAQDLEALADAGVPESVIDVVVAKSFPKSFQVNPEGAAVDRAPSGDDQSYRGARRPLVFGPSLPMRQRMMGFGWYGNLTVPAFFYGSGYGYPGYWGYRPGVVVIERRGGELGDQNNVGRARVPKGRIIRGQGYTRPGSDGGRSAVPRTQPSREERPSATAPRRSGDDEPTEPRRARRRGPGGGSGG
jgi:hypothetical protein